jgi:hypothetical protein
MLLNMLAVNAASELPPEVDIFTLRDINTKVRQITKMRHICNFAGIDKIVGELKVSFTLREVARLTNHTWSNFHWKVTKPVLKGTRLITETQKKAVVDTFTRNDISMKLPYRRQARNYYMRSALEPAYDTYAAEQKALNQRVLSISSVVRCLPKGMKAMKKVPYRHCLCETCLNCSLIVDAVRGAGVKGISRQTTSNVLKSICSPRDSHADGNGDSFPCDEDVTLSDCHRLCVFRKCTDCGEKRLQEFVYRNNISMDRSKNVHWVQWEGINDANGNKVDHGRVNHEGDLHTLLQKFYETMFVMSTHLFHFKWQAAQFESIRNKLEEGDILMVMDFGMNFEHKRAEEPQASHWYHKMTTVHPVVCYIPCPEPDCHEIVTEELMMLSSDTDHDAHAVKAFEDKAMEHFQEKGYNIKRVVQFTDNCSSQYKSKLPFEFLSDRPWPIIQNYFGQQHGKGPGDSLIGRVARRVSDHNRAGLSDIGDTLTMYEYCKDNMTVTSVTGQCTHTVRYFYMVENISRAHVPLAQTLVGTRQYHSVRNTGHFGYVEVRESSCFCSSCMTGQGECDEDMVGKFTRRNLIGKHQTVDQQHENQTWPDKATKSNVGKLKKGVKAKKKKGKQKKAAETAASHADSHADSHGARESLRDSILAGPVFNEAYYGQMLTIMSTCTGWEDLLGFVADNMGLIPDLPRAIYHHRLSTDHEDELSTSLVPNEAFFLKERSDFYMAVATSKDGNCLPHVLSRYCYGHEGRPNEMRLRMCFEGIYNFRQYVNSELLVYGGVHDGHTDLARLYAERSGQAVDQLDLDKPDHVLMVYQMEIADCTRKGTYCGLWALHVASNVLGRPIQAWYPDLADKAFSYIREFLHRTIEPFDTHCTRVLPAVIMWTATTTNTMQYDHFVSVFS